MTAGIVDAVAVTIGRRVDSDEFEAAGVSGEWIRRRMGIDGRRWLDPETPLVEPAAQACRALAERSADDAGVGALILVSSSAPRRVPGMAQEVALRAGLPPTVLAFDLNAVCTGFPYGLATALALVDAGHVASAVVCAAEAWSRLIDPNDRNCAVGCWRVQVPDDDPADHLVLGGDGGVSLALLTLARRQGFRVAMTASSDTRLALLDRLGITPIDRREFPGLASAGPGGADRDQARRHRQSLADLRRRVDEPSDGRGVSVFADNIGQPLFEATRAVLARQGVITTCGWKAGMRLNYLRGAECIDRHLFVHTHVWRYQDSARIRDDIEETGWLPDEADTVVYGFDEVPELATAYSDGRVDSYFPLYRVA